MTSSSEANKTRRRRYLRITVWSAFAMLLAALVLPMSGYVYVGMQEAQAQGRGNESNPRSNFWRAVRDGETGYSAVTGIRDGQVINGETGTLINGSGQNWRSLRVGIVANYGGWAVFAVAMIILLFFALRGSIRLDEGRAGVRVKRWSAFERLVHWYTAALFVILTVTGLSIFFGRVILTPVLGPKGFAAWAGFAHELHNLAGPALLVGVIVMIVMWISQNLPEPGDLEWFAKGGGAIGKNHPSAGRLNAGEKLWFWFICTGGVATVVTGMMMGFPGEWGQTRSTMQLANLIHGVGALSWIAFWIGHAYIGTVGSEGSFEAMSTGYVDVNWAKQHHDRWYAEIGDTAEHLPDERTGSVPGSVEKSAT